MASHFFLKTPQEVELFTGYPDFKEYNDIKEESAVTASMLSPCGRFLVNATSTTVKVFVGEKLDTLLLNMPIENVYDVKFSPAGNFLGTWERASITDPEHQNVKIWYLNREFSSCNEEITPNYAYQSKSQNGWFLQFSKLDNYALKKFGKELRIVKLDTECLDFIFQKPFATLSPPTQNFSTYQISPAEHPTVCTFTPEKGGKPAHLTIWPITQGNITKTIATKTFFKADSCQLKWNHQGNAVLCIATTDFDSSNKSYYGENTLYLLSFQGVNGALGGSSVRVPLSKEGPIHDVTWSPTSRQFGVIYGFMPATITFFDLKANIIHSLPDESKNTLIFSPTGRYIIIAGFGNLQGAVDILDRHDKFRPITHFNAANSSVCQWSPGGNFILTATTSPRLRVDNGVKIWHVTGALIFAKDFKELLRVSWRNPCKYKRVTATSHVITDWSTTIFDETNPNIDPVTNNPTPAAVYPAHSTSNTSISSSSTASGHPNAGISAKKPSAYKPPHARRAEALGLQKTVPGLTAPKATPAKTPPPNTVPGMAPKESKSATKNRKKRAAAAAAAASASASSPTNSDTPAAPQPPLINKETSPEERRIRSLLKKLRAIESLKQRQALAEKLEDTQLLKIQTEQKVLDELAALGWDGSTDS